MENLTDYIFSSDLSSAQQLLNNGYDINIKYGAQGIYPIQSAINSNNLEALKFLIKNGANVNIENGLPILEALDLAIDGMLQNSLTMPGNIYMDILKVLLDNGADPTIKDNMGNRPIDIVNRYANYSEQRLKDLKTFFRPLLPDIDNLLNKT